MFPSNLHAPQVLNMTWVMTFIFIRSLRNAKNIADTLMAYVWMEKIFILRLSLCVFIEIFSYLYIQMYIRHNKVGKKESHIKYPWSFSIKTHGKWLVHIPRSHFEINMIYSLYCFMFPYIDIHHLWWENISRKPWIRKLQLPHPCSK